MQVNDILNALDPKLKEYKDGLSSEVKKYNERLAAIEKDAAANQQALDSLISGARKPIISPVGHKGLKGLIHDAIRLEDIIAIRDGRVRDVKFISKSMTFPVSFPSANGSVDDRAIGIVGTQYQPRHVSEILFRTPMTTSQIPIVREGTTTGSFDTVAEGSAKPLVDFSLSETPAKAQTIAAIVKVSRQMFFDLDEVEFANWMTQKLTEMYELELDDQLLNGNGTPPNLSGINNTGNFTAATSLGPANDYEQLVRSIIQLQTLGRTPDYCIIHPTNLAGLLLNQASSSGIYDSPPTVTFSPDGSIRILGVPLFVTVAQPTDVFTVIDNSGFVIGDRENFSIRIFEQNENDVELNMLTIRAESRTAFAVYAANYAVKGTFV